MSKIFIYPTDTVWGIGGSVTDLECYKEIARIKETALNKPLSLLFNSVDLVSKHVALTQKELEVINLTKNMGMTFGVYKEKFQMNLPEEVFSLTDFICFRILNTEIINKIIEKNGPITSTSLNKTKHLPISELDEARSFWKKYAGHVNFYQPTTESNLSGSSSTIILLQETTYHVVREGENIEEIREIFDRYYN